MFLKNKNIIFKIRRSKVTDYAALTLLKCISMKTLIKIYMSGPLGTKNRSRANCVPINADVYQDLQ